MVNEIIDQFRSISKGEPLEEVTHRLSVKDDQGDIVIIDFNLSGCISEEVGSFENNILQVIS